MQMNLGLLRHKVSKSHQHFFHSLSVNHFENKRQLHATKSNKK